MIAASLSAFAPTGFWQYVQQQWLNTTFTRGAAGGALYQPNAFDLSLLIPYFTVLIILAFYGCHRYALVFFYYKNRAKRAKAPAARFAELPLVTVQLPIYNEQFVVARLVEAVCRLDYPRDRLEIQLLDDSTDETAATARAVVERYAAQGYPIVYRHRDNRAGFKAGALQAGMEAARGEFITIFDADFVPPPDFLRRTIDFFTDPKLAMVQTRWGYINRDYSWLTRIEAILLDGHFVLEHGARFRTGLFFNFNGTAGVWRRAAIQSAGGWQHDTLTEDTDLSYRAQLAGWKFLYVPEIECPSELPAEMNAFKVQQARWAKGLIQTSRKILPDLLRRKNVTFHQKIEAWCHLTSNISYPLMIVLCALVLPAMIVRFYQGWFQMLYIDLPLFIAASFSISSFYLASQRELYPRAWFKTVFIMPVVMAVGIGLAVTNSRAVLEALLGIKSSFRRTPKFGLQNRGQKVGQTKYRRKTGWTPVIELGLGAIFFWVAIFAWQCQNFITLPFILLFVFGFWTTGLASLLQGRFHRRRPEPAAEAPAETPGATALAG